MATRIAVLGAGPGGLCMAHRLTQLTGVEVDLIERTGRVGGLHHSVELDGLHYDTGTFLFHDDHGLLETFPSIRQEFVPIQYCPASITPRGGYDSYPFSIRGYLRDNGFLVTALSAADILWSKCRHYGRDSVPAYARYYTGGMIYHRSGLKQYICRLHDTPDDEVDVVFAQRRMHVLARNSLRQLALKAVFAPYRRKTTANFRQRLVRPRAGMPYLYDLICEQVEAGGANLLLQREAVSITREAGRFVVDLGDRTEAYDRIISTIPMPTMLRLIGRTPEVTIENRDLVSLFFRGRFKHSAPTFFNFTYEGLWKRITVFSKFYGMVSEQDYFTVEVTTQDTSPQRIDELRRDFEDHARSFKLLDGAPEFVGSFVSPRAYPLYRRGQMQAVENEKRTLQEYGIDLVGRQGNFEYVISHVVAQRARDLANKISCQLQTS